MPIKVQTSKYEELLDPKFGGNGAAYDVGEKTEKDIWEEHCNISIPNVLFSWMTALVYRM